MIKIKSIKFKDHDILGNLELDFCDKNGNPADTIIIAGENGTGKTTILEEIKNILEYNFKNIVNCQIEYDENEVRYENGDFWINEEHIIFGNNIVGAKYSSISDMKFRNQLQFDHIYSPVCIDFSPDKKITTIKANDLDTHTNLISNIRFNEYTATTIKQLFVDINNHDNKIIADNIRKNINNTIMITEQMLPSKIDRFNNAFNFMFDDIKYKCIKNIDNSNVLFDTILNDKDTKKYFEICFEKNDKEISIDDLSSGEKQIVFRGAFLLRDKEALNGAVVLIDEPEISMHPKWQNKIMDFYKKIFQNKNGKQTSQIIVTTHSPFIIHNENRYNDKVIVLQKTEKGVKVSDKPEYYNVDTIQAVADAFNLSNFSIDNNENIVFLEGKTDEQYFNKAIEVFGITDLPFKFKAIDNENIENQKNKSGGSSKLDTAYQAAQYMQLSYKCVFLYDCDKKKKNQSNKNLYIYGLEQKLGDFNKGIEKGIENLLILNHEKLNELEIFKNFEKYYIYTDIDKGYGKKQPVVTDMHKTQLCEDICNLDNEQLKIILSNLKIEIEKLKELFK